jgi:hypothetical protein
MARFLTICTSVGIGVMLVAAAPAAASSAFGPTSAFSVGPDGAGDVAADGAGNIYALAGGAVRRFDAAGTLQSEWGGSQLGAPAALAAGTAPGVYVADNASKVIRHFSPTGTALDVLGNSPAPGAVRFQTLADLAVTGDGLVVVDGELFHPGRVRRISAAGAVLASHELAFTGAVTVDADQVYVRPDGLNEIEVFRQADLAPVRTFTTRVWDQPEPLIPEGQSCCGLAVVGQTIWAGDQDSQRLEAFTRTGDFVAVCPTPQYTGGRVTEYGQDGMLVLRSPELQAFSDRASNSCIPLGADVALNLQPKPRRGARYLGLGVRANPELLLSLRLTGSLRGRRVKGRCRTSASALKRRHARRCGVRRTLLSSQRVVDYGVKTLRLKLSGTTRFKPGLYRLRVFAQNLGPSTSTQSLRFRVR